MTLPPCDLYAFADAPLPGSVAGRCWCYDLVTGGWAGWCVVEEAGAAEPARVLVVTLDARLGQRLRRVLETAGYAVRWEWSTLVALAVVAEWHPAVVVVDWQQAVLDSPTFTAALQVGLEPPPPVVALVTDDTMGVMQVGVAAVLPTTVDPAELVATIGRLLAPRAVGPA